MTGNFWDDYGVFFIVGLILWPRILLLYYGAIHPQSFPPIFGFSLTPRMFVCTLLSASFGDSNPTMVVVCWIVSAILDVVGFVIKMKTMAFSFNMVRNFQQNFSPQYYQRPW